MSKIVAPAQPPTPPRSPDVRSRWWRLWLQPNEDQQVLIIERDGTDEHGTDATWVSWEFFDGTDTWIDFGLDRPTVDDVRCTCFAPGVDYLDVLSINQPTPAPGWVVLTEPGDWDHPEDELPFRSPQQRRRRRA